MSTSGPVALRSSLQLRQARPRRRRASRPATANRRACRRRRCGTVLAGAADRGQPEHARRAGGKRDGVAADQREAIAFARRLDPARGIASPTRRRRRWSATARRRPASRPWRRGRTGSPRPASSRRSPADRRAGNARPRQCVSWVMTSPSSSATSSSSPRASGAVAIRRSRSMTSDSRIAQPRAGRASLAMASSRPLTNPLSRLS